MCGFLQGGIVPEPEEELMAQSDWLCRRNMAMDAKGRNLANVQGMLSIIMAELGVSSGA